MRADEQIVFTSGNAPLRCGRAIWFRREDMKTCVGENRFHRSAIKQPQAGETDTIGIEEIKD